MTITDERREELIETLEAIGGHLSGDTTFALLRKIDARDILAMLREGAAIPNHAAFVSEVKAYMQKASSPPTITFRPYEPPKPTLDQMPEGEPHRCSYNKGLSVQVVAARVGDEARRVYASGGASTDCFTDDVSRGDWALESFIVLDADPPQPETLADVPDWCVVEGQDGRLYFRKGEDVWLLGEENPLDIKPLGDADIKITRVLGYPVVDVPQSRTEARDRP